MATLNDLPIKSISLMEREELISHILRIRNARRFVPKPVKESTPKAPKERKPKDLLSMLSPEQAAELLAQLGGLEDADN